MTSSPSSFERSQLGSLTKLGGGGQGDVYRAPNVRINFAASVAFKEYKPAWRRSVDFGALEAMAAFLEARSFGEGSELVARVAWPTKVVTDAGVPVGFLMPEVADEFRISVRLPSGKADRPLAALQLLLNPPSYLARLGIALTERDRYLLLAEIAESLALFHRYDIAVGDLSPKNVLFSLTPSPRCFFVDADAMRLAGRSALPQAETPDWEIRTVSGEELATAATDGYKLGLLALRLLAGDQSTHDSSALPGSVPSGIRGLLARSLSPNPSARPASADWVVALRAAASTASTAMPVVARSRPTQVTPAPLPSAPRPIAPAVVVPPAQPAYVRSPSPSSSTAPDKGLPWGKLAGAGVAVVIVALVAFSLAHSSSTPKPVGGMNPAPSLELGSTPGGAKQVELGSSTGSSPATGTEPVPGTYSFGLHAVTGGGKPIELVSIVVAQDGSMAVNAIVRSKTGETWDVDTNGDFSIVDADGTQYLPTGWQSAAGNMNLGASIDLPAGQDVSFTMLFPRLRDASEQFTVNIAVAFHGLSIASQP